VAGSAQGLTEIDDRIFFLAGLGMGAGLDVRTKTLFEGRAWLVDKYDLVCEGTHVPAHLWTPVKTGWIMGLFWKPSYRYY
jgi:hypothetical protein